MIRFFDFIFSFLGLVILSPLLIILFIICLFESNSPLFRQERVGRDQKLFLLLKFRTMKIETKSLATHLINDSMITRFGFFLRHYKLDEIPQLLNVFFGEMSIVGPRPCLPNQKKLILQREKRGVNQVRPGITGLAQILGINMKTPTLLAKTDQKMIKNMNLYNYFYYIFKTIFKIIK
jgi:lipopolysaccharide/colanic/teichoic acid biosynthesis glycosyltransferase